MNYSNLPTGYSDPGHDHFDDFYDPEDFSDSGQFHGQPPAYHPISGFWKPAQINPDDFPEIILKSLDPTEVKPICPEDEYPDKTKEA